MIVEKSRRRIYDSVSDRTEREGIDLEKFYSNSSYFRNNEHGNPIACHGSHPTVIHWPLTGYRGGTDLLDQLTSLTRTVNSFVGADFVRWVQRKYWHSTVFSPVHSSDADVIAQSDTDIGRLVRMEVPKCKPYLLVFTRIISTVDGGLLAVGYAQNDELDSLRTKLLSLAPSGSASSLVHITLGHLVKPISADSMIKLNEFTRRFRRDTIVLGQIRIDFLTYAIYHAPFLDMRVEEILRLDFECRG